jgi:hypothetical protein
VAQSLFHRWKKEFNQDGITCLQPKYHRIDQEVKKLQSENERLKRIIANQALELDFKNELLKKLLKVQEVKSCIQLFESKIKVSRMLQWCGVNRSSFYYRCKTGKKDRKPSTHTLM